MRTAGYTVDPVIEELVKLAPLLLMAWNVRIRRQWGLTDHVVLGAALGAGFGLLEAVARYGLDAARAIPHPAGGWAIPDSLRAPYIPGPEQVLSAWFPAPQGALELGDRAPGVGASPHLVYTALAALGVGVLLRAKGWVRALGVLPPVAACVLHMLTNYAAAHPADRGAASRSTRSRVRCGPSRWCAWRSPWPPTCGRCGAGRPTCRTSCCPRSGPGGRA